MSGYSDGWGSPEVQFERRPEGWYEYPPLTRTRHRNDKQDGGDGTRKTDAVDAYPFPLVVWRVGAAVWIALDGEHDNVLQRTLRERFPEVTLVIGTLATGSTVWYLPDANSVGKGLYQEEASILAQGSLEAVIEAATAAIREVIA